MSDAQSAFPALLFNLSAVSACIKHLLFSPHLRERNDSDDEFDEFGRRKKKAKNLLMFKSSRD